MPSQSFKTAATMSVAIFMVIAPVSILEAVLVPAPPSTDSISTPTTGSLGGDGIPAPEPWSGETDPTSVGASPVANTPTGSTNSGFPAPAEPTADFVPTPTISFGGDDDVPAPSPTTGGASTPTTGGTARTEGDGDGGIPAPAPPSTASVPTTPTMSFGENGVAEPLPAIPNYDWSVSFSLPSTGDGGGRVEEDGNIPAPAAPSTSDAVPTPSFSFGDGVAEPVPTIFNFDWASFSAPSNRRLRAVGNVDDLKK